MKVRDGLYLDSTNEPLSVIEGRGWHLFDDLSNLDKAAEGWSLEGNEMAFEGAIFCVPMELML